MRAILILSLLMGLSTGAVAEAVPIHFDLAGHDEAASSVLKLVPLAEGASLTDVRILSDAPGFEAKALEPMTLRGLRVVPVVIAPEPGKSGQGLPASIEIEVRTEGPELKSSGHDDPGLLYGRGFFEALASMLPPGTLEALPPLKEGRYLIITHPDFEVAARRLAAWKTQEGLEVSVVTTTETGSSKEQIQSYISQQYHNAPVPPQFVVLVGDVDQVPALDFHGDVTDHPYALLDGDDFPPGPLRRTPLGADTTRPRPSWRRSSTTSGMHGRPERVDGARSRRRFRYQRRRPPARPAAGARLQIAGFGLRPGRLGALRWQAYAPNGDPSPTRSTTASPWSTYRGWAVAERGWGFQTAFLIDDVNLLHNNWMLPVVFSFVCANNKYDIPSASARPGSAPGQPPQPTRGRSPSSATASTGRTPGSTTRPPSARSPASRNEGRPEARADPARGQDASSLHSSRWRSPSAPTRGSRSSSTSTSTISWAIRRWRSGPARRGRSRSEAATRFPRGAAWSRSRWPIP